jgi:tRNA-splicing ligase RtcB
MPPLQRSSKLLIFASEIEQGTIDQAEQVASMPFIHPHVALMPDAHVGKGSSVGTVIPTEGAVIPAAVGVDIGCGMIAVKTRFQWTALHAHHSGAPDLHSLRLGLEDAIPLSPGNYNSNVKRFPFTHDRIEQLIQLQQEKDVVLTHSPQWTNQLGSLGGGNHFIELCVDEKDNVWLFLHSGSRGVGNKIATFHIKKAQELCKRWKIKLPNPELAYLPEGDPSFTLYIRELHWAQQFALLNREEMMDRFVWCFGRWLGVEAQRVELERINCHHNYTTKEQHGGKSVWVTRKGAIAAHSGKLGVIPGSMGTRSYVVRGKGSPAGLCSAMHGAGRRYSRTEAKKRFTEADLAKAMEGIEYRHGPQWIDEIPMAYKDIDKIMEDGKDLVEVVTTLKQVLNVKGT